jgi:hypothetical protein
LLGASGVIGIEALLIVKEILIFFFTDSDQFWVNWGMVGDIDVRKFLKLFMVIAALNEISDLTLHLLPLLVSWIFTKFPGMLHLQSLETESVAPVPVELLDLVSLEEDWLGKLLTPIRSKREFVVVISFLSICVINSHLIEKCTSKTPDVILIETVIDGDMVWIWRVSIHGFTLNIIVLELFIVIFSWNNSCSTNDLLVVWGELLQSLEGISLLHGVIVDITQEAWIVNETLMPSQEWVIKSLIRDNTINEVGN